uniref:WD repeat domain 34 n=1 Tax=Timema poppense TaxID=170557 RepID=A0A7R9GVI3_TIMPO|nr:unnamed protein product [Timema poppensis]
MRMRAKHILALGLVKQLHVTPVFRIEFLLRLQTTLFRGVFTSFVRDPGLVVKQVVLRRYPDLNYIAQFIGMCRTGWSCISGCNSPTNGQSETRQMAVCCPNPPLRAISSRSVLPLPVGGRFQKFGFFLNTPQHHKMQRHRQLNCLTKKRNLNRLLLIALRLPALDILMKHYPLFVFFSSKHKTVQFARLVDTQTEDHQPKSSVPPYVDEERLAAFLKRICPAVLKELDKVNKSRAFIGYEPIPDDTDDEIKQLHTLETPIIHSRSEVKVSGLSWSCSGGVIALGYSHLEHDNWCDHNSSVQLYNINRADTSPTTSYKTLETSSCVTSLKAHPSEPSLLAVGTFSGELLVWNLQSEDEILVGSSAVVPGSHREAITHVSWIRSADPTHQRPLLVTSSSDGRVLVWSVGSRPGSLRLVDGFVISMEYSMKAQNKVQMSPLGGSNSAELGVTCFSFSPHDPTSFVVGVEGGTILKCSTITAKSTLVSTEVHLRDPVLSCYDSHQGAVTCINFSPHLHGVFLTCSTDKEIHIYHTDQQVKNGNFKAHQINTRDHGTKKSQHRIQFSIARDCGCRLDVQRLQFQHNSKAQAFTLLPLFYFYTLPVQSELQRLTDAFSPPSPAQVFYSDFEILGVSWCPSHQHLFAAWGMGGTVDFFDLKSREVTPVLRLYSADKPSPVSVVSFNPSSNNQLAAAKLHGKVIVWKIPVVKCVGHVAT